MLPESPPVLVYVAPVAWLPAARANEGRHPRGLQASGCPARTRRRLGFRTPESGC